jgi:hypothetical protein
MQIALANLVGACCHGTDLDALIGARADPVPYSGTPELRREAICNAVYAICNGRYLDEGGRVVPMDKLGRAGFYS